MCFSTLLSGSTCLVDGAVSLKLAHKFSRCCLSPSLHSPTSFLDPSSDPFLFNEHLIILLTLSSVSEVASHYENHQHKQTYMDLQVFFPVVLSLLLFVLKFFFESASVLPEL